MDLRFVVSRVGRDDDVKRVATVCLASWLSVDRGRLGDSRLVGVVYPQSARRDGNYAPIVWAMTGKCWRQQDRCE
jgi:hypothetical protein